MAWRMLSDAVSLCYTTFAVIPLPLPLADTVMTLETVSFSAITSTQDNFIKNSIKCSRQARNVDLNEVLLFF